MEDIDVLRPYPIDPSQDKVVRRIVFAKRHILPRIAALLFYLVTYPLMQLTKHFNRKSIVQQDHQELEHTVLGPVHVCTRTRAMDSKYYYAVHQGRIWFKPIAAYPTAPWKLFGGNGFIDNSHTPLVAVSADGDNILAVDHHDTIHYAKSNQVVCQVSFDCPQWQILESQVKWTEKWFNMDGVSLVVNLIKNPILKSLKNARSIAMSHKGHETMYYTDMIGKKHPDPYVGVTTIYTLNDDGTRIFFADPWLQNKFGNELTTPDEGEFKAETLAASGSTVFLLQRARDETGKEIHKMYTRFADFDSIGSNPALKASYNPRNPLPLIRFIPAEDWLEQPIIVLQGRARLTKNISILQLGWGQNHRELRVQGQNEFGQNGYYSKRIYAREWHFQVTDDVILSEEEFLSDSAPPTGFQRGPKIVHDYDNGRLEGNQLSFPIQVRLEKFAERGLNERGLHTKLILIIDSDLQLTVPLYARRGWKSLFGISHANIWKLVLPLDYFDSLDPRVVELLEQLFHNRARHSVHVDERKDELFITNIFLTRCRFRFCFKTKSQ